jgi:hypothetical protein
LVVAFSTTQEGRILETANAVSLEEPQACYVSSVLMPVPPASSRLWAWPLSVSGRGETFLEAGEGGVWSNGRNLQTQVQMLRECRRAPRVGGTIALICLFWCLRVELPRLVYWRGERSAIFTSQGKTAPQCSTAD